MGDLIGALLDQGQSVYVHCTAGVSRSATVVIFWLMRSRRMSLLDALKLVKAKRPAIRPFRFLDLLLRLERALFGATSNREECNQIAEEECCTKVHCSCAKVHCPGACHRIVWCNSCFA